ncbi:MAG: TetR/AcrR family transcriptional regulator [Aquabacterium sp.]
MSRDGNPVESDTPSTRTYGGVSSEERRQERRERLIESGLEVFGTRGLGQSTMRDICTRARLTDRYFYESFANVQEAFEAVYVHLRGLLLVRLQVAMASVEPEPVAVTEAGLRTFFEFVKEDPRCARIMLIDVLGLRYSNLGRPDLPEPIYAVKPYVSMFSDFIRVMYPRVAELDVDVDLVNKMLIGMTVQSAAAWAEKGFDKSVDDIVRHNLFAWQGLDAWVRGMLAKLDETKAAPMAVAAPRGRRKTEN